jgi:protein-disulfide isomerase
MASKKQRRAATAAQAREAARAEAARLRAIEQAKARRRRNTVVGITLAAVAATVALVIVVVSVFSSAKDPTQVALKPVGATESGGFTLGTNLVVGGPQASGEDVVTVDIYSDYICPYCGDLEEAIAKPLQQLLESNKIKLVLHPLALLDNQTEEGSLYSTRSANAAAVVAAEAPEQFLAFHEAMFAGQPEEGSAGLTDDEIIQIAKDAGVADAVADTFPDQKYKDWVSAATEKAVADGLTGTPLVYLTKEGGKRVKWTAWATGAIAKAVDAVAKGEDPNVVEQ